MEKNKKILILITIVFISLIQALQYCVSPVLGKIQSHFPNVESTKVQMLLTIPSLPSMIVAILSGWLIVKISKKRLLLIGCLIAGIAGLIPFCFDSFKALFFSRTLYGLGLGIALVMNTAVVAEFFHGKERVIAMGIQSASIGASMILVNAAGGFLGRLGYQYACLLNVLGFVSMAVILFCLPDTGKVQVTKENKIQLNGAVFRISIFMMLETLFVTAYTANIAMHVTENLTSDTGISGTLSGIFSATQMLVGLILGYIVKITKEYTLPVAMSCLILGGLLIVLFPSNFVLLGIGSMFCGLSQGIFVPQASVELTNSVTPATVTIATAICSCMMNFGQLIAPTVLNTTSEVVLGAQNTSNAFIVMIVASAVTACIIAIIWTYLKKKYKMNYNN